jgi:Periplasmic copper-binding protein (NosD)
MADTKISDLPPKPVLTTSDEFLLRVGSQNYRASMSALADLFELGNIAAFETVALAISATISSSIKTITTGGYTVLGSGGAVYRRSVAPTGTLVGNRGFFQSADGGWWQLDIEQGIKITMFGAEIRTTAQPDGGGLEPINDAAVSHAQVFCANVQPGYFVPLIFPVGRLRISTTVPLVGGMNWRGEGITSGSDTENTATIFNNDANMFSQAADMRDVYFTGLDFDASGTAFDIIDNAHAFDLQWSKFQFCAFKNARRAIRMKSTGSVIKNCMFQGNNISMELSGSDMFIQDNFIDSNHTILAPSVLLTAMSLASMRGNFITGRHKIPLVLRGNCQGCRVFDNEFDISDYGGVFCDQARGFTLFANTFNKLMQYADTGSPWSVAARPDPTAADYSNIMAPVVAGVYSDAEFRAHNSYNFNLHDNIFMNSSSYEPVPFPPTHKLTSTTTSAPSDDLGGRAGHDVYIDDVNYRDGKVRNINVTDLNICAPRLGSRHPAGILNVTTGSVTIRPGEYSVITANLVAAATITIANYPQDCKDAETILINKRAGSFDLTIRTGDAGGVYQAIFGCYSGHHDGDLRRHGLVLHVKSYLQR